MQLQRLADAGLVKGKTVGIDATTPEANAALRSLVRRDRSYTAEPDRGRRNWKRDPDARAAAYCLLRSSKEGDGHVIGDSMTPSSEMKLDTISFS